MDKIIIEIIGAPHHPRDLRVFSCTSIRVGRGYGNDMIMFDPYVSANHAVITLVEGGQFEVTDLNSENGVMINSKEPVRGSARFDSGSILTVGNTKIRVFGQEHGIAPTQKITSFRGDLPAQRHLNLWYALAGFFILYYIESAASYPFTPLFKSKFVFKELAIFLVIFFWAGIWALLGRLMRHKAAFGRHLTWICFFSIAMIPIFNCGQFIEYLFADQFLGKGIFAILVASAFAILLFAHLGQATALKPRPRVITAILVPALVVIFVRAGGYAYRDEFKPDPYYLESAKPPLIPAVKVISPEVFIANSVKIFAKIEKARLKSSE